MNYRVLNKKFLLLAAALLLLALLGYRAWSARKPPGPSVPVPSQGLQQVELASADLWTVQPRRLALGLPLSGTLRAVNSAYLKARVAGELQGLQVREGDVVKAGQVLAHIEPTEYLSRQRQAREQAQAAKAQIEIAQRQYDNNQALVTQGFISRTALDTSASNLALAQANYQAALATLDVATKAVDDTVLRAPLSGQVAQRLAQPGERLTVDARVLEIVDPTRLELEANFSPADSLQLRIGQPAQLQVEGSTQPAEPAQSAQSVAARVVRINPAAQAGSRSVLAYLQVDSTPGLRQGLYVQGRLGLAAQTVLAVPLSAVRTDQPTPYVMTVEGGRIVHRPLTLGDRGEADGEAMVAIQGVPENTLVVAGNIVLLAQGTPVRVSDDSAARASASPHSSAQGR